MILGTDGFITALQGVFPTETEDILTVLLTHPASCSCEISIQAWRVMSSMCSAVHVFKAHCKPDVDALKAIADDLSRKELKLKLDEIIKNGKERIAPEVALVAEDYQEFVRLSKEHAKDIIGLDADSTEQLKRLFKNLFGE